MYASTFVANLLPMVFWFLKVLLDTFHLLPLQLDLSAAWFNTDDYNSRLTIYEKSVLYAFSMPSFYYKGMRVAVNARYELNKHIILQVEVPELPIISIGIR